RAAATIAARDGTGLSPIGHTHILEQHARLQGRAARPRARARPRLLLGAGRAARPASRAHAAERLRLSAVVAQRGDADPDPGPALLRRPDDGLPAAPDCG